MIDCQEQIQNTSVRSKPKKLWIIFYKTELKPTQEKIIFLGYHFNLKQGSVSNCKETKTTCKVSSGHGDLITNNLKIANVPYMCTSISRKDNSNQQAPYASVRVLLEYKLAISPVIRFEDPCFQTL